MKNNCILKVIMLLVLGVLPLNAFAGQGGNGIIDIYMTGAADDFLKKDIFTEDQTPWLYLKLKDSVSDVTGDWWFWNKGNQDYSLSFDTSDLDTSLWNKQESDNPDGTKNLWLTRFDLEDVVNHDQWWHVNNVHSVNPNGGGSAKYHVNPEPVSSALFLLGAGALGSRSWLRKRRKA